jgi:hypothetical protein
MHHPASLLSVRAPEEQPFDRQMYPHLQTVLPHELDRAFDLIYNYRFHYRQAEALNAVPVEIGWQTDAVVLDHQ